MKTYIYPLDFEMINKYLDLCVFVMKCMLNQEDESFEEFFKSSHYWSAVHF